MAARYLPAAAEAEVGGDWYDVIPIAGGAVGLVMGDVAGKGLAGASMVGRLRSALRAYALEGHDAGRVVERLNRLLWTEAEESQMATMLYAIVDPAASAVRWVNAGHPPPLLIGGGDAEFLQGDASVPLGVLPFPTYEEVSAPLEPGPRAPPVHRRPRGAAGRASSTTASSSWPPACARRGRRPAAAARPRGRHARAGRRGPDDVALLTLRNLPVPDRFSAEFPAEPESLAPIRSMLRRWLSHAGADELEIAEITTACGEAATNAIEHAGTGNGTGFEVSGRRAGRRGRDRRARPRHLARASARTTTAGGST